MSKKLSRMSEPEARAMLEGIRWPNGVACVKCGSRSVGLLKGKATRPGVYKCRDCRKQFTVTVGTIFERSHINLADWVYAFDRMCCSKKGVSALQVQRELGVTYKTAWFMCHRIREAMNSDIGMLGGHVEVDETYVGGKPRPGTGRHKRGHGTAKTPVLALVERDGRVKARVITAVSSWNLKLAIYENVSPASTIYTDELNAYQDIGFGFEGGHKTVNHGSRQYVGPDGASTNTIESYFALIKRGVYGTFHNVSKKHLNRYCDEFSFRWNGRKLTDTERTIEAIRGAEGKRLMYR